VMLLAVLVTSLVALRRLQRDRSAAA
jgi:hypothetical protein